MNEVWQLVNWREVWLSAVGGFLGGGMMLAVLDAQGLADSAKRLFCSLAWAYIGTQIAMAAMSWFRPGMEVSHVLYFSVSSFNGTSGWYVAHWLKNYLESTKNKTIWQVAGDVTHRAEKLKKGGQ